MVVAKSVEVFIRQNGKVTMKRGAKPKGEISTVMATSQGAGNHTAVGKILKKQFLNDSYISSTLSPPSVSHLQTLKMQRGLFSGIRKKEDPRRSPSVQSD